MEQLCKILIVDDEFIMRQGFRYMIDWEKEGYELVGEASDGQEGLQKIEELHPHIVFTDIVMSKMDGMEFVQIIQRKYPDIRIVVLSSYDNFLYVKNTLLWGAVDYILKPTLNPTELLNVLRKVTLTLPDFCKKKTGNLELFEEEIQSFLQTPLQAEPPKQAFTHGNGCFFGVWYSLEEDRKVIEDICARDFALIKLMDVHALKMEKKVLFFVSYEAEYKEQIWDYFKQTVDHLLAYREELYCIIGHEFHTYEEMKKEYFECMEKAFAEHFYNHSISCLNLNTQEITLGTRMQFDFNEYSKYLNSNNYFKAAEQLRDYLNSSIEHFVEESWIKNLASNMFFNMVTSMSYDEKEFEGMRKKMMEAYYVEDFRTAFETILEELLVYWNDTTTPEDSKIRPILDYIDLHYNEELSLTDIADQFGFNYNYLSSYFSTIMKEGYSSYLNQVRIKKACMFLEQGELPISEVGVQTGYLEHSYFCRVFKKKVGCTPREYRKKYLGRVNHEK